MYFYSIFIIAAYSFIKLSIGFFLLRLADRTRWRPFLIGMLGTLNSTESTDWTRLELTTTHSLHWRLHNRLNIRHNLPMHPRTSRLGLHFAPTYRVSHPLNFSFTFSKILTQHQYRQMLRRRYLQKRRRIQLLHQHRNRPNLRPDPHPHGLAPASHTPDTHRSRRDLESGFICLGSGYLQDAYAVQLLQDY
jgi:hypothetical protein